MFAFDVQNKFRRIENVFGMHRWSASWSTKEIFQNDSQWVPIWDRKQTTTTGQGVNRHKARSSPGNSKHPTYTSSRRIPSKDQPEREKGGRRA